MSDSPPPTAQAGGTTVTLHVFDTIPEPTHHGRDARATPPMTSGITGPAVMRLYPKPTRPPAPVHAMVRRRFAMRADARQ